MKTCKIVPVISLFLLLPVCTYAAQQSPAASLAAPEKSAPSSVSASPDDAKTRSEIYYDLAMGHFYEKMYEQMYESSSRSDYANQAIELYKKAYALDPKSSVIGERLAEMYWKTQRIRDAVLEAQQVLKRDPDDVAAHRLLGRIYVRSLGDGTPSAAQSTTVDRAVEQYREILRLDPQDTEAALWLSRLYRLQNQHGKAEQTLRDLLKRDPQNESGVEQLTQLLADEGKSADAILLLEGIVQRSPTPNLLDMLGDAYTQAKDPAKAEMAFRKAVELDPSEASHRRGLGQSLLTQEKYKEALEQYQKLAEMEPDDAETYLRLSQAYRGLHQLDLAEQTLLRARQHAPGSLEVIYNEAMLYESQGRFEDSIRVLSDAAATVKAQSPVTPSSRRTLAALYQQLGRLYREVGRYPAAINTFQEMLRLGDEEERHARVLIVDTYRQAKDLPHALEEARKALQLYPKDPPLRTTYAMLLGEKGDTDEGVRILKSLLTGKEADRELQLDISQVYERGRRYAEAEEAARAAEKIPGRPADNEMVWFMLGAIYERQKMFDRAETEFRRVLEVNPRNAAVLNYYGYMLGDLGIRLEEARALVQRALVEDPYNGAYLDSLGWIYYKQNRFSEAETSLLKAVERESRDPTIHGHLGDVYFKTGRPDLAAAEWEKSLAEWHRALPTETEEDKVAELEKKIAGLKHRVAQDKSDAVAKPQ
ncbi:MAG TPA: tetratricopeptide repeat protein [Candidatus Acidoferrales bacterium]|nr:tetratricopeptide repeat protein [Candidatus Acidoferrales bacterium]